ncbi:MULTISPECIES: hypothetical protein [unclassified Amycolatopsis]|uniref:hypothetical protein n=1 Tax=unclassified Amycolatopsis TaxID=2618356 RepID=UPI001C6988B5|nr:hypothetical protein [Amycolatopsis sp. DSM 110486]QYN19312.1 hypothetical protein K1T34_42930 [Amycolatopsis sp. DSM 110486]
MRQHGLPDRGRAVAARRVPAGPRQRTRSGWLPRSGPTAVLVARRLTNAERTSHA